MNLIGDTLKAIDDKMMLLSIFVDLCKAFDTIPHSTILSKLDKLGVKNTELQWFRSYMCNRQQYVNIGSHSLTKKDVTVGVQQGSLLGVLLFQILINDLPSSLKFSTSILYADDTTLYVYGRTLRFLWLKMQGDVNCLSTWLNANCLSLNVKKTKLLLFNSEGLNPKVDIYFEGAVIENVNVFKFLGIHVDSKLGFSQHYAISVPEVITSWFYYS